MDPNLPSELRQAITDCRERGLLVASKWAAECLAAIPVAARIPPPAGLGVLPPGFAPPLGGGSFPFQTSTPSRTPSLNPLLAPHLQSPDFHTGRPSLSTMSPSDFLPQSPHGPTHGLLGGLGEPQPAPSEADVDEQDTFELARAYFDARELDRCAWTLRGCQGSKAAFLRVYASYLSVDKRMQEGLAEIMGGQDDRHQLSASLQPLLSEIKGSTDPFQLYLKGTIYLRLRKRPEAAAAFVEALNGYACNWSAYVGLAACVSSVEELETLLPLLPTHPFTTCFEIHTKLDLHSGAEAVGELVEDLERDVFSIGQTDKGRREGRTWVWGASQKAMIAYHLRDFDSAEASFDTVQRLDPYRLDDVDTYSNMLYVIPKLSKLAQLAKEYSNIDRNRAETCALIGNFYSSRGEHPKAIQYFRRALQLNRDYLPAWTLMGHEYVEMKNSHAAIEAYRRAVDCNPRDYRAWYGLGQTYELLDMPQYAISYYNKATALRPFDWRMWHALAQVYDNSDRKAEAVQCQQRALSAAEQPETAGPILLTLAGLQHALGRFGDAARTHRLAIANAQAMGRGGADVVGSWMYLARFELGALRAGGGGGGDEGAEDEKEDEEHQQAAREPNWALAASYLSAVTAHNVSEKDEALALLKEIDAKQALAS